MKRNILCTLLFLSFTAGSFAQTASNCTASIQLTNSYSNDIKDLALNRLFQLHSPDTALIDIPLVYQDSILAGLAAINNTGNAIQADSVFRDYCIHVYPHGTISPSLMVYIDTSYAWAKQWVLLHTTSGYGALDSFMNRYNFTVTSYMPFMNVAVIATPLGINTKAFGDSLLHFQGVYGWERNNSVIGNNMNITYNSDSVGIYTFWYGWGDCLSGCTSSKTWVYVVDNSCNVTLNSVFEVGSDPYPTPVPCNLPPISVEKTEKLNSISVFPNPVYEQLNIKTEGIDYPISYTVSNFTGTVLLSGKMGIEKSINTASLPFGLYLLNFTDTKGNSYFEKVVKE